MRHSAEDNEDRDRPGGFGGSAIVFPGDYYAGASPSDGIHFPGRSQELKSPYFTAAKSGSDATVTAAAFSKTASSLLLLLAATKNLAA